MTATASASRGIDSSSGHLAEEVALAERRHHGALLALATGDLDDARLDHEHVDPLLALAEDDLARFDGSLRVAR